MPKLKKIAPFAFAALTLLTCTWYHAEAYKIVPVKRNLPPAEWFLHSMFLCYSARCTCCWYMVWSIFFKKNPAYNLVGSKEKAPWFGLSALRQRSMMIDGLMWPLSSNWQVYWYAGHCRGGKRNDTPTLQRRGEEILRCMSTLWTSNPFRIGGDWDEN